jgi:hypothetical protein
VNERSFGAAFETAILARFLTTPLVAGRLAVDCTFKVVALQQIVSLYDNSACWRCSIRCIRFIERLRRNT